MKLIIASINSDYLLEKNNRIKLGERLLKFGVERIIYVSTMHKLFENLDQMKDEEIMLISNFSPNSEYGQNSTIHTTHEDEKFIYRAVIADSYSTTEAYFRTIFDKYRLRSVLFITGAPESMLGLGRLKDLGQNVPIGLIRKGEVIKSGVPYQISMMKQIVNFVKGNEVNTEH